ncbi:MAG: phytanoyl-CoA dioxygenase family protein, partial [Reyranella sp.]|nr:phytanoyl-CoA dioxygenase family protein [Reyranella sp.]
MTKLSQVEVDAFHRDGYYAPVDVFSIDEARRWRADLEAFEATLPPGPVSAGNRRKLHVRCPWARDLVGDPRLLDVMESILGPDILVFTSTFFIKEPGTDAITAWHQDATYFGLQPYEHVTAWVALSDASIEAGCMEFIPGSHRWGQLEHGRDALPGTINAGARSISQSFDTSTAVFAPLKTGQVSLHHTLIAHNSPPNGSNDRRIGFGISYIP